MLVVQGYPQQLREACRATGTDVKTFIDRPAYRGPSICENELPARRPKAQEGSGIPAKTRTPPPSSRGHHTLVDTMLFVLVRLAAQSAVDPFAALIVLAIIRAAVVFLVGQYAGPA